MNHLIVYCSPNESTRHVAEVIAGRLTEAGCAGTMLELGQGDSQKKFLQMAGDLSPNTCLWIGSPVYVHHPVPPIENFIARLPQDSGWKVVPFVTWGGVTSGTALYEMARGSIQKGCVLIGAAKVIAVHSSLWRATSPLGGGHPDTNDDHAVQELVDRIRKKLSTQPLEDMALKVLDYQSPGVKDEARRSSIAAVKMARPQLQVDVEKCVLCGDCAQKCPAQCITLAPHPKIGSDCFICLRCVRECPQEAFPFDAQATEARLRAMAATKTERPLTQIFY